MDVILHHIRVGCCNDHFALIKYCIRLTDQQFCIQCLQNVFVRSLRYRKNTVVVHIHVRICNIADGDQSLQSLIIGDRQGNNSQCTHHIPCFFQGNLAGHTLRLTNLNIADIRHHIRYIDRWLCLKKVHDILGFLVDLTCTGCHISSPMQQIFQFCIRNRRTDGIRIRILMSNHIDWCCVC